MSKLLFLTGCIPVRLMMVYLAYFLMNTENKKDPFLLLFLLTTLIMGIGFWVIYLMNWRKTGVEVGGGKIWWNHLRPIHGTNFLLFTLFSLMGWKKAWLFLLLDVMIGAVAFFDNYK